MAKLKAFIWQWGRFGAGPRISFELSQALKQNCSMDVLLSLSHSAELLASEMCRSANDIPVTTYNTKFEFAARTISLRTHLAPLLKRIAQEKPDVALSVMPGYWDSYIIRELRRMGIPVVTIVHDATNHPGDRLQLVHWLQKRMIRESSGIVTLTDYVAKRLRQQTSLENKKVRTIPHPTLLFPDLNVQPPHKPTYPERSSLRLLLTGRLRKYKGIDLFLEAISQIDAAKIDIRIAGSIADKAMLAQAENMPNIDIHDGWMSEQHFQEHIDWCDAVVIPYREASQSGIIPSAYARWRPVIATPVGGLREQVRHEETGLLTSDASATAIAQSISRFIEAPDMLRTCAEGAHEYAQTEIGWQNIAHQYADFISEVATTG